MKTVLITAGAKRLGKELVTHFHRQGWHVLFTAHHSFEEGIKLKESLGENVECIHCPVSTQINAAVIANWAKKYTDSLDLLVCNASIFEREVIEDVVPDSMSKVLNSNLLGPYFLIQQCLPMLRLAHGSVVNIGDVAALNGIPQFSAYAISKAGLLSMTKSLSIELAPKVRVNIILPGTFEWPLNNTFSEEEKNKIQASIPLGRIGDWNAIVNAVDFLANADYITGTAISVDGGKNAC